LNGFLVFICTMQTIKNFIPNLFTLSNLFCGVLGIYFSFHEALHWAAVMIFIGGFFDFFDGMIARMIGAHSELGKQLDSLADMVTFGVLPGIILFNLILSAKGYYFSNFDEVPISAFVMACSGFLIPLFGALRLAKFNIDENQADHFVGIPTPAAAIFVAGLPIVMHWQYYLNSYIPHSVNEFIQLAGIYYWNNTDIGIMLFITNVWFYVFVGICLAFLMVLPLPILSFKFKNLSWKNNTWRYSFLIIAVLTIAFAFIHDIKYLKGMPYVQWLVIPILIAELIVISILKNLTDKN
jgi:CDP-diacylglycerol--serine O-phosphatidyltransferase